MTKKQIPDGSRGERLPVKSGLHEFNGPRTRAWAIRIGTRNMPAELRRAGFKCVVLRSDAEIHGGVWFRIVYEKQW